MQSKLFRLGWADLGKGIVVSIITAIFLYFQTAMTETGFTIDTINWIALANIAIAAGLAYLTKNLVSDDQGNILGFGRK